MHIWLVTVGEPLPTDEGNVRLHRCGILAGLLAEKEHDVTWWTSTFDHFNRTQRYREDTTVSLADNYRLRVLRGPGYKRNISLKRIWDHYVIARKFKKLIATEPAPDVILCSLPTLELSVACVEYGKKMGIPVVLDIRDMWPDIFLRAVPRWAQGPARLAMTPMTRMARTACAEAFAIFGHAPAFVDWGLDYGNRKPTRFDKDFPFGYVTRMPEKAAMADAEKFWKQLGVGQEADVPVVCFFGTLGHQFAIDTVIEAARRIESKRRVQIVLCGSGDRLDDFRRMAADCRNVVFPGWVDAPKIRALMQIASLALAPYHGTPDFEASIPNKAIEYLSGGLPILSSMKQGILNDLLSVHDCGISYDGQAQKLEQIIGQLCDRPEQRAEMSNNALRLFEDRFTASKVYGEMIEHLQEIASGQAVTPRA